MADIYEIIKSNNGKLEAMELVHEKVTDLLVGLYIYMQMLPQERQNEIKLISEFRSDLTRLRWYIDDNLIEKPK